MIENLADPYSIKLISKLERLNESTKYLIDLGIIKKAIVFAKKHHAGQKRDSGDPFYSHPITVANMVSSFCFDTDIIVASILHDIVEDTDVTIKMIRDEFGDRVAEMVERLTRVKLGEKITIEESMESLYHYDDKHTLTIKVFDRLHNLQTIDAKSPEKQKRIAKETLEFFTLALFYLDMSDIKKNIIEISRDILANYLNLHKKAAKQKNLLEFFQVLQNDTLPNKKPKLKEPQ